MVFGADQLTRTSLCWLTQTVIATATTDFAISTTTSVITYLVQEVWPRCLHAVGGFRDRPIKWWLSNFAQTLLAVAIVTKIYGILTENAIILLVEEISSS